MIEERGYYQACVDGFAGPRSFTVSPGDTPSFPVYSFTAEIAEFGKPQRDDATFRFPPDWRDQVAVLSRAAAAALDDDALIYRPPGLSKEEDPARRLSDPLGLPGLDRVVESIASQIESSLYGCHVAVDKVHVYRQMPSEAQSFSSGSWVWHADGHPSEFIKAMVYLSDVDEGCSAFQLLWSEARSRALRTASAPMHGANWISGEARTGSEFDDDFVASWDERGYRKRTIHGPAGTTILFATNCVHRGTIGKTRPRDTLILRLRPTDAPERPRLQSKSTIGRYTMSQPFAS